MEEGQMTEMNLDSMRELMLRMGDSLKALEIKSQSSVPTFDASNKEVIKEISDEIRQNFFRKKDQTPQVIGSVFGVIALISAMTAIIQPMNRSITDLRKEIQAAENRLDQRIKDKDAYNLTIMDNAHKRLNALESGDQEDKTVNAMVMMQEDRIKTLEVRTLADRTNHAKIDMLYMHFIKDHDKGGI